MGNNIWGYKSNVLASTNHLKINLDLLQKVQWNIADIEDRTQRLIDEIAKLYPYYEADDLIVSKIHITLTYKDIKATAYYYPDNGSVKILAGSQLLPNDSTIKTENYPAVEALRNDFLRRLPRISQKS